VRLPTQRIFTQSGVSFPDEVSCFDIGENVLSGYQDKFCFGEQPVSWRSYVKRYFGITTNATVSKTGNSGYTFRPPIYPNISPSYGGSSARPDFLSYIRYAYLGMIGGMRFRFAVQGAVFSSTDPVKIYLNEPNTTDTTSFTFSSTFSRPVGDMKGTVAFVPNTQGGMEVELPMYTNNFFLPSGSSTTAITKGVSDTNFDNFYTESFQVSFYDSSAAGTQMVPLLEVGTSEDTTLFRWMSSPFYATTSY
jgi:hypothetical protein